MPEQPPSKRDPVTGRLQSAVPQSRPYAELHCYTNFSFLRGASHADELVTRAAELGLSALAITDRNSLAGVVRAHVAAKAAKLKLLIGSEITPVDAPPVVLWAMNRTGYANLCRLITRGRRNAPKGECRLAFADVAEHADGLLSGVVLGRLRETPTENFLARHRELFGDRAYALAELHRGPNDRALLAEWRQVARQAGVSLIAANDVHCHVRERQRLQDVLTAIRHGCTVAELGERRCCNAERHLKSPAEMAALFSDCPDAVARTVELADRCGFSLDELRYEYPEELCPRGLTPIQHLINLTWIGARERYPRGVPDKVRGLIEHELKLIDELHYAAYFLTVWDLVRFARERGILCQGRGSAANSVVCFCLGVTSVDPDRIDVLFERFISKERGEAPDIDVDFEHSRREEVIQYLYGKYGRERAAMTAAVISYRPRSAVRDVGKALGLSLDRVAVLAKQIDHLHDRAKLEDRFREVGFPPESRLGTQLIELVEELLDTPRHLSQHTGGMVLTQRPLCELVPIANAAMPGRTTVEWDKDDLDALGILKVDVLALGMLTAIRKCFELVRRHHGRDLTLATVPAYDRRVFDMICRADTMGVFQIESRAQMSMLPRLKPRCHYDLVIEVAIVRPGPIQGDMVHPYLRRRAGQEPVEYPDDRIRSVLEKTLGVPIFQEQAMKLVMTAAGFTPGEADQLRRAMAAWRRKGEIEQFRMKLIDGMTRNGYCPDFAERVFRQLRGFSQYGFPESHAASFALLVWVSAWLKYHYPAAFAAALLNSQPMGFYAPAQLVTDARKHGVTVLPVDVNFSAWDCTLERVESQEARAERRDQSAAAIRLGFRMLSGFSGEHAEQIVARRGSRSFVSLDEFAERTGLSNSVLTRLSRADAFASLRLGRRTALWQSLPDHSPTPLLATEPAHSEPAVTLPQLGAFEEVVADYRTAGLSLRAHPLKFLRPQLDARRITPAWRLSSSRDGQFLRVAGLVMLRQRPSTAKGITFVTLEDETGIINLIVQPEVWERHHQAARTATVLMAHGVLQRHESIIHVLVGRLEDLSRELAEIAASSRDFR
jgi:error-prone DNA polymerase